MSGRAHSFAARRDRSEKEIADVLRARGFAVRFLSAKGLPDLLVWKPSNWMPSNWELMSGWPYLIECKTGKGKLRETQDWDALGLRVHVLRTAEEAMQWNR
jgi:hypothetical protein